jgi:hypothetical protein
LFTRDDMPFQDVTVKKATASEYLLFRTTGTTSLPFTTATMARSKAGIATLANPQ